MTDDASVCSHGLTWDQDCRRCDGPMVADETPRCDHICLKDAGHVERGEPHFYGYEIPSPRVPPPTASTGGGE